MHKIKVLKNLLIGVSMIGVCQTSFAQEKVETIYYDKDWKGVENKSFADFYRLVSYPKSAKYKKQFRDYYITGELQGTGGFISIDEFDDSNSIFDGECITYHKNGKVSLRRTFEDGQLNGEFCEYSEDGLVVKKGRFIDGQLWGFRI